MKLEDAYKIKELDDAECDVLMNASTPELMQLSMGACLLDDGISIVCLECGLPNECCICSYENNK
ncbi:hypothetical protein LCGC14_1973920 [marine sediment metagenome]|uniref:Uncharacterized protein n=1 Tax=marine sediment metagenome TaxID=412755 RepID=A0A0F9FAW0_9ZZZZ